MEWDDGYPTMGRVYSDKIEPSCSGRPATADAPVGKREEDMAKSVQVVYERAAFHVLNGLHAQDGPDEPVRWPAGAR